MPVKVITTEFGHSLPPEGPHTVTVHVPLWNMSARIRDGDQSVFARFVSIYPRFSPWGIVRDLAVAIGKKLGLSEETGLLIYTSPDAFPVNHHFSISQHRKRDKLEKGELTFKVIDVHRVRLYVVGYPMKKTLGILGAWQNAGIGISSRLAESLLPHVYDLNVVDWSGNLDELPTPSYLPENESHRQLRERISGLMHRAAIDPAKVKVTPDDVYLYVTGMAGIYYLNKALLARRPGTILVLGAVFHNTWDLFEEAPGNIKHFADCSAMAKVLDKVEQFLEAEMKAGRRTSYVFTEFPSNPVTLSVDLKRLRQLANKFDFVIVTDDTVGGFCNIDLMLVTDVVLTSMTKSFSGYANVMGGSVVLNPGSPQYREIKPHFAAGYHNEYFTGDADVLLANSADYLERSAILNRNAAALARLLKTEVDDAASPVTAVFYPAQDGTVDNYKAVMRRPTIDFTPGYGGLLSVEFEDTETAIGYYDNLAFHCGPHFGAHLSLAQPYNMTVYGKDKEQFKYHIAYGLREAQIRMGVGLEDEVDLIDTVKFALQKAREAKKVKVAEVGGGKTEFSKLL